MSPGRSLRRSAVAARDAIDGWLHASRRERARAQLRDLDPSLVLFVCLGNVCRSPYAERVWRVRSTGRDQAASCGFIGPGRSPPELAIAVARARGIEHADHLSETATTELLKGSDAVICFDRHNVRRLRATKLVPAHKLLRLGDFDPVWSGKRSIVDPWGKEGRAFEQVFDRIERCVDDALEALGRLGPP